MLELLLFKTLWGHEGTLQTALDMAIESGFKGIEGPAPLDHQERIAFKKNLADSTLKYIAEITTAGTYVPERSASLQEHVDSFKSKLDASIELNPLFITSLAGCDAWPENQSIDFFGQAMDYAKENNVVISFETHRSRSFFNPWSTQRICKQLPDLKLTFDFSHWCVVCERLMDTEIEVLNELAPKAQHIHARVGYDQGPQVPDPAAPRYRQALKSHQKWWRLLWQAMYRQGFTAFTMTPEFGPDGYQAIDVITDEPVGDLWRINQWMGQQQQLEFQRFQKELN